MRSIGAITVAFLWALCYPLVTIAVDYAPPLLVAGLRAFAAGAVLLLVAFAQGRPGPRRSQYLVVVAIGATSTGLGFAGMFLAGGLVTPGIATVLANTQPLLAALIGLVALREPIRSHQAIGMTVAFAGIGLLAGPALLASSSTSLSAGGVSFVLMGALGVAAGNVLMKRFVGTLDVVSTTAWQLLAGSVLLLLASCLLDPPVPVRWTTTFTLTLAGLSLPGTALPFVLWFALLRRAPLNTINAFTFLTPLFALGIAAVWYDERLDLWKALASALVLLGAAAGAGTGIRRRPLWAEEASEDASA